MDMLLFCILFFIIYEIDLLIIRAFDLIDKIFIFNDNRIKMNRSRINFFF